ncbi:MAG: histidine kinase,HDOD proteinhistidine kinase [Planctomycetota bacterium]|nr:histidine kinase,HDOD proteinhistidine kinase [Planctomycetota bacterium]
MRPPVDRNPRSSDLRRALGRLEGLPLRPLTVIAAMESYPEPGDEPDDSPAPPVLPRFFETDPGWVLAEMRGTDDGDALHIVGRHPWWRVPSKGSADAIERLWRHAVATSGAAKRLAVEAGREDVDAIARAGLLQQLGLWAVAAVNPSVLTELLEVADRPRRIRLERSLLGQDLAALGRDLAEKWCCGPLLAASAWLHADRQTELDCLTDDPEALTILQKAFEWAEKTPWALFPSTVPDPSPSDARLRILIAEVQVRCGASLLDPEATEREERATRSLARLRVRYARSQRALASRDRVLGAIAAADPSEDPASWAERASRAWCEEPGVASAKVIWGEETEPFAQPTTIRPPSTVFRLGRSSAKVSLWAEPGSGDLSSRIDSVLPAWSAWAELLAERDRRGSRLDEAISAHRSRVDREETADRTSRLASLAEFAGGAGHELNNPLAVILGRAQLLLPHVSDPGSERSLRVIIGQAQRAHRILRDLMYVARPPAIRPRPCQPDEIVRASLRDLKPEAEARGVRLVSECREPVPVAWADPDPLRHLMDVLVRNALEATPSGGTVRVSSGRVGDRLSWIIRDSGRGIALDEGKHLFEPFFCGRQAGRGLGLGLPRVARFIAQVGGDLSWRSTPGQGSVFSVVLPIEPPAVV